MAAALPSASPAAPALEEFEARPPASLPDAARRAVRVLENGKVLAEVWVRPDLTRPEAAKVVSEANFAALGEGTLVAVARFPSGWSDYRGQRIGAGAYALRYALLPVDGNHVGTADFRDFLLLVPASEDPGPETVTAPEHLLGLSRKASGRAHPAVLALLPPEAEDLPALSTRAGGTTVLGVAAGAFRIGLVLMGRAEIEE